MEILIKTKCGEVKGESENEVNIFRGIPFATADRFEMPKQYTWDGVFEANGEIDCPQYGTYLDEAKKKNPFFYEEFRVGATFEYKESPLTLNIIAPNNGKKLPVIVFIHGGGFETGTVGELPYGTSIEYAKRNVILVSLGYRVNVFGFFRGKNLAIHDQIFGINWVKENIEAFGGDKDQIIIMGQSAGAMCITDLFLTQKLKGVVKGAIMISGAGLFPKAFGSKTIEEIKPFWDLVRSKCSVDSDEELKNIEPEKLWNAWFEAKCEYNKAQVVLPEIDGDIIPDNPHNIFKRGEELDIPILFSVTSQDYIAPILFYMGYSWAKGNYKKNKASVWGYFFDKTPPGNKFKAYHSADLWYLFGNMDKSWREFKKEDYELSSIMIDYIANFAKNLNPNGQNLQQWDPISKKQKGLMVFDGVKQRYAYKGEIYKKTLHSFLKDKGPM